MKLLKRRSLMRMLPGLMGLAGLLGSLRVLAEDDGPDQMIQRLSAELLDLVRSDQALKAGDVSRIEAVVDERVMPHVNFTRMTASTVGPAWRQATPEQRQRLQDEFKILLIHTYAGALSQVDQQSVEVLPLRAAPEDKEVIVRTLVKGMGEPVQVDYRMERAPGAEAGWRIYDLNVVGIWMVANYRSQFREQINRDGLDGLIEALTVRNSSNAAN